MATPSRAFRRITNCVLVSARCPIGIGFLAVNMERLNQRKALVNSLICFFRHLSIRTAFVLPIFVRKQNKYPYLAIAVLVGGSLYLLANHFPLFPAHLLRMTSLDRAVPFVPQTVWIYNSDMILFFSAYIICKDMANASKYLYSFIALLIPSVAIFFLWPTTYPRYLFPLPPTLDPWTTKFFDALRNVDAPSNCLPSLHVSISYLSAFVYLDEQKEKFPLFFGWATLIALSTLTTKQHYVADVVTGLGLAITIYFIFRYLVRYKA